MADIELVIKIPEETYKDIQSRDWKNGWFSEEWKAIHNGIPLPKGHGNLIDGEVLHHKISEWLKPSKPDETEMVDLADIAVSTMIEIEEAPTIIEADGRK